MGRLGTLVLKALGVLLLSFIVLSVIATLVGIALSVVATVVSIAITLAVLGLLVLGTVWLASLLREDSSDEASEYEPTAGERDPQSRLQERYVAGELTEAEFERELDRLMGTDGAAGRDSGVDPTRSRDLERDRRRR